MTLKVELIVLGCILATIVVQMLDTF